MERLRLPFALSVILAACGGSSSSSSSGAKSASNASAQPAPLPEVSIGDTALAQGGLDSLGGGRNRSNAQIAATASGLRFDRLDKDSPVKMDGSLREWPARSAAKKVVSGDASKTAFAVASPVRRRAHLRRRRSGRLGVRPLVALRRHRGPRGPLDRLPRRQRRRPRGVRRRYVRGGAGGERGGGAVHVGGTARTRRARRADRRSSFTGRVHVRGRDPLDRLPRGAHDPRGPSRERPVHRLRRTKRRARRRRERATGTRPTPQLSPRSSPSPSRRSSRGFSSRRGSSALRPRFDIVADVAGDAMKERIAVYDQYLTICGPHYRGGTQFFFRDLGGELREPRRAGDHRARQGGPRRSSARSSSAERTRQLVRGVEHPPARRRAADDVRATRSPSRRARATWTTRCTSRGTTSRSRPSSAMGWDVTSYKEPTITDVEPVLLPWGAVKSQVYRFDGAKFAKVKEVTQQPAPGAPGAPSPPDTFKSTLAQARAAGARDAGRDQGEGPFERRASPSTRATTTSPRAPSRASTSR